MMRLKSLIPKLVKRNISPKTILLTMSLVVLRVEDIRDPPNPKMFLRFFGGGHLKRLENEPNGKLC